MGFIKQVPPCVQLVAAFSASVPALEWIWSKVENQFGPIGLLSPRFPFSESAYYNASMGDDLQKQFAVMEAWYDPAELASHKLVANAWEDEMAQSRRFDVPRPLNIDPGYMSMTKLVLASTKNREHRLYLRDGIYAEVTLAFRDQRWQPNPWTYPDYQREDLIAFFQEARQRLAKEIAKI